MFRPLRGLNQPGGYPATEDQARHLFRNLSNNGLHAAFQKVQGRVLIDTDLVQQILADRARNSSAA